MRAKSWASGRGAMATLALIGALMGPIGCGAGSGSSGTSSMGSADNADAGGTTGGIAFPPTGNQYVDARRCPGCHQSADPQTTGFMAGAPDPVPGTFGPGVTLYGPNLTPDPTTGLGNWNDDQIATAIRSGIDNQGERLCPQMAHFPDMGDAEMTSILGYLHSLKPVMHATSPSHCPPLKR